MSVTANKKTKEKTKNIPKSIYFKPKTKAALEEHMKRERLGSFNLAVNDAVEYALFSEHRNDRNADVVKLCTQTIYSLNEHRMKTARDLTMILELVALLTEDHLLHTHQIPDSDMATAKAQAKVRLNAIMEQLARNVPKKKTEIAIDGLQKTAGTTT